MEYEQSIEQLWKAIGGVQSDVRGLFHVMEQLEDVDQRHEGRISKLKARVDVLEGGRRERR